MEQYRSLADNQFNIGEKYNRFPDLPVTGLNWFMAARYCNLLSKAEHIPEDQWCYEINGNETKLRKNYLSLTGYRLPSEAEMEYATRAGAVTSRLFGETEALLGNYAWYLKNANDLLQRTGLKKPNDFGLFDMQGNCFNWCQETYGNYPVAEKQTLEDKEDPILEIGTTGRVLRGGSYFDHASNVRSAYRNSGIAPAARISYLYGFRPVRTFTP